jgi:hypothetical protein
LSYVRLIMPAAHTLLLLAVHWPSYRLPTHAFACPAGGFPG